MGDAERRKRAAEQAGRCEENDRQHVPGDFRARLTDGLTCSWCGKKVNLDG